MGGVVPGEVGIGLGIAEIVDGATIRSSSVRPLS